MPSTKRLVLRSETIRTLTGTELDGIVGGTSPGPVITISLRICRYTETAVKATAVVVQGAKKLHDHYKGAGGTQNSNNSNGPIPSL